jgi:putative membrane protein
VFETSRAHQDEGSMSAGIASSMRLATAVLMATAILLVSTAASASAAVVARWDNHFVIETIEGARFEIQLGRIAQHKGQTRETRSAGHLMVTNHSGELHAAEALAKSLEIKVPSSPSITQLHQIGATSAHTGAAFDRAYARLEVGDHIMDIQGADGEILEGSIGTAKTFAQKYRLMYQRHLAVFRQLAADVHAH